MGVVRVVFSRNGDAGVFEKVRNDERRGAGRVSWRKALFSVLFAVFSHANTLFFRVFYQRI